MRCFYYAGDLYEIKMIYLDYNATTPLDKVAQEEMARIMNMPLNPSSLHSAGRKARGLIEGARGRIIKQVGTQEGIAIFTSSASEANALALDPYLRDETRKEMRFSHLLLSAGEHPSILKGGRFEQKDITLIALDKNGVVNLDILGQLFANGAYEDGETAPLVSVQYANSETGVVQPIKEIADIVHEKGGILHCDAVQALGRLDVDMKAMGVDLLTLSSHKLGGPLGVGVLVSARHSLRPNAIFQGGGQERGFRAGTENVMAIAGFDAVLEARLQNKQRNVAYMQGLRDYFEQGLKQIAPDVVIHGEKATRLCNTSCFSLAGQSAQNMLIKLDLKGFSLSAGSACSSGKLGDSHVLKAMYVAEDALKAALRMSLGIETTKEEINALLKALAEIVSGGKA